MRVIISILFLFYSAVVASAQISLKTLDHVTLFGNDYVRLQEWCEANDLKLVWTKKDEELRATSRSTKLIFAADSRKTEINGVTVLFSLPVTMRNGVPFISALDIQTTLHPLLFPRKDLSKARIDTICIDPGHGGKDIGNPQGRQWEKTYTLLLAEEIARLLDKANIKVILTRSRDTTLDLSDRAPIANRNKADLFVSLHYNSANDTGVRGLETYCMSPAGVDSSNAGGGKADIGTFSGNAQNEKNVLLAYYVQKTILKNLSVEDRGIKRARFEVLREAKMPAILIEAGFMSSTTEARKIYDSAWRKKMAQAIVDGILTYKKRVEPVEEMAQKKAPEGKASGKKGTN